jgi:hypothetical protein
MNTAEAMGLYLREQLDTLPADEQHAVCYMVAMAMAKARYVAGCREDIKYQLTDRTTAGQAANDLQSLLYQLEKSK